MNSFDKKIKDIENEESPYYLLCELCTISRPSDNHKNLKQALSCLTREEFLILAGIAERNSVLPLFIKKTEELSPEKIELLEPEMIKSVLEIREAGTLRIKAGIELFRRFEAAGLKLVILKGCLFASEIYGDPGYKKMNDLDLLLHPSQAERGLQIFREAELISVGDLFGSYLPGKSTHHTPSFLNKELTLVTGLHWDLVSPYSSVKTDLEGIFSRLVKFSISGVTVYRMSWEDNLFHLCIHLPFYKTGLRELADFSNLILYASATNQFEWELFIKITEKSGAFDPVYRCLKLASETIPFDYPKNFLNKCYSLSEIHTRNDTEKRGSKISNILEARSTYQGKIEKYFVLFKVATLYREKFLAYFAMWFIAFFPPVTEMRKIVFCSPRKITIFSDIYGYLVFPFFIWKALARDHGKVALWAITLFNFLTLIKETFSLPFKKKGVSLKKHPHFPLLKKLE